jgi:hypothetical protein
MVVAQLASTMTTAQGLHNPKYGGARKGKNQRWHACFQDFLVSQTQAQAELRRVLRFVFYKLLISTSCEIYDVMQDKSLRRKL